MPMRRCEMKKVLGIYSNPDQHWVGDGFPVHIPSLATILTTIMWPSVSQKK
jgi:hypothetical protein